MKISRLKLANAVKCGPKTEDFLTDAAYDMTLSDGVIICIKAKARDGVTCYTTLMNTIWWHPAAGEQPAEKTAATKEPKGKPARSEAII